jgi:hypothetical protein
MTVERKIVVGLEDVEAITLECLNPSGCRSKFSASPDSIRIPTNCPQCGHEWMPPTPSGHLPSKAWPYVSFLNAVRAIRAGGKAEEPPGFRIILEFKEPRE